MTHSERLRDPLLGRHDLMVVGWESLLWTAIITSLSLPPPTPTHPHMHTHTHSFLFPYTLRRQMDVAAGEEEEGKGRRHYTQLEASFFPSFSGSSAVAPR